MATRFGNYAIPTILEFCEGQVVVRSIVGTSPNTCPLQPGDIVTMIDGVDINEIIADRIQYFAVPNENKIRDVLPYLPICTNRMPSVTVLRDGALFSCTVRTVIWMHYEFFPRPLFESVISSHTLLDGNIGLINPSQLSADRVHAVMEEFSGTSGLIIDLRQYPNQIMYPMAEYLLDEIKQFATLTRPFLTIPGSYFSESTYYAGPGIQYPEVRTNPYFYDKPVVLLMNQHSQSHCEYTIMCLRTGPNVTVIGSNSIGADGNVASLQLPCGTRFIFTSLGVYTPEGGQTQRIGLSPNIYVEPTIEGIRDGRDELMEAAISFLLAAQ